MLFFQTGEILSSIASEHGFEADEEGTSVIDHLNFDVGDEGRHTLVVADPQNLIKSKHIVGDAATGEPLLYQVSRFYRSRIGGSHWDYGDRPKQSNIKGVRKEQIIDLPGGQIHDPSLGKVF